MSLPKFSTHLRRIGIAGVFLAGICIVLWRVNAIPEPPTPPPDADADGLLDAWEIDRFGSLAQTGLGDPDSDGLTNLQEYQLGTNPNDNDSDDDGIMDGAEIIQGRNPNGLGMVNESNVINLRIFSPRL